MSLKVTIRPGGTGLCPMCREAISREARKCPHCQSDLTNDPSWQAEQAKAGCAPMIVLGFLFIAAGFHWLA